MANRKFTSKIVEKFQVSFVTTPITANSFIEIGRTPKNCILTNGWAVVRTELGDADDGDNTTLAIGFDVNANADLFPATALTDLNANVYVKLIPGVINIVANEAITTIDTPAEAVGIARATGDTFSGVVVTTTAKAIYLSASNDQNIDKGTMTIWLEYYKF